MPDEDPPDLAPAQPGEDPVKEEVVNLTLQFMAQQMAQLSLDLATERALNQQLRSRMAVSNDEPSGRRKRS